LIWTVLGLFKLISKLPIIMYEARLEQTRLLLRPFIRLLYRRSMIDCDDCEAVSGMNDLQGKPKHSDETCPSAAPITTDFTLDMT
jgi:hypothetical protein